jgi:FkbM family methyltransferase
MFGGNSRKTDETVRDGLARVAERIDEVLRTVGELRLRLDALAGQVAAAEWQVKLQPAGVPVSNGRILTKTLYGTLLYVDANDRLIAPHLLLDRAFEPEVSLLLQQTVQPGDTFVDVGANIGYYACTLARKVGPNGRVFAYEANPEVFNSLRDNIIINNVLAWTQCRNIGVWDNRGVLDLHRRNRDHGNTSIIRLSKETLEAVGDTSDTFQIECDTLDSLLADYDGPIAVVKIDVEGAEAAVLRGMRGLVTRNPQIRIVLEWALWTIRGVGGTPEGMWELIRSMGFEVFKITSAGGVQKTDLSELVATEFCYLLLSR